MDNAPSTFASNDLLRIRRNPWVLGLAASPLLVSLFGLVGGILVKPVLFALVAHPLILGLFALAYAWRRNPWPVIEAVPVRADANGVLVGALYVPRAEIRAGFVRPSLTPQVKLRRRWATPIELQVGSTEEARSILRVLGLDVSQTVAEFRTLSRAVAKRRYIAAIVGVLIGMYGGFVSAFARGHGGATGAVLGLGFFVAIASMITLFVMPTKLSVGADGIVLRWFFRDRFISYGDVAHVERYEKGVGRSRHVGLSVALRSGEEVLIPTGHAKWGDEELSIIGERIRQAMETFRSGDAAADAAMLRRGARRPAEWVAALRAIGAGANADMRTAPLPRERLFRIVESPTAPAAERAAAAVALGGELDDETRGRLRVAADASASPKLRVVLTAAASGASEAELEAALSEVATEDARALA
jgi:hypothetical protein